LVELRGQKSDGSLGLHTIVPPSLHPKGEEIRFEKGCDGYPANTDAPELRSAVAKVAALACREMPEE
jgi:hypothetical protein